MRVRKVTATAFGALTGATLTLGERLTVITGANESGKSTWHAAIYAAICGRPPAALQVLDFEYERRPRPPGRVAPWSVKAELALADGRVFEIHQDLANPALSTQREIQSVPGRTALPPVRCSPDGADSSPWYGTTAHAFATTSWMEHGWSGTAGYNLDWHTRMLEMVNDHLSPLEANAAVQRIQSYRQLVTGGTSGGGPLARAIEAAARHRIEHDNATTLAADLSRANWAHQQAESAARDTQRTLDIFASAWQTIVDSLEQTVLALTQRYGVATDSLAAAQAMPDQDPVPPPPPPPPTQASKRGRRRDRRHSAPAAAVPLTPTGPSAAQLAKEEALRSARFALDDVTTRLDEAKASRDRARVHAVGPSQWVDRTTVDQYLRFYEAERLREELRNAAAKHSLAATALTDATEKRDRIAALVAGPSLPSARADKLAADLEVTRLRRLDETIAAAERFVGEAQRARFETFRSNVTTALERDLPALTNGRRHRAELDRKLWLTVDSDPPSPTGMPAGSAGLRSQLQLAMLLAVGGELSRDAEPLPLLLDDVISDADTRSVHGIMTVLQQIAAQRQVILFSVHDSVEQWATQHLGGDPRNVIHKLPN